MRKQPENELQAQLLTWLPNYLSISGESFTIGRHRVVTVVCDLCDTESIKYVTNIKRRVGLGCLCQRHVKYRDLRAHTLGGRYDAMIQRCKPGKSMSKNYGDRGIRSRFRDREHYITWVLENLPHKSYKGVDIDRINNDGDYEPGNLRLVTRTVNLTNRRQSRFVEYMGMQVAQGHLWHLMKTDHPDYPYSKITTENFCREGLTPEEMLARKKKPGVGNEPTTYRKPDPDIVSLYRES